MSPLFGQTLREPPTEAEVASHQLLLRAGFIRQLAAGIFTIMPLGQRTVTRIETIIREEMNAIGGQEMTMPVVHPADLWRESGRWYQIGSEMGRFQDKNDRDMVLAMTHEEVVADLLRRDVRSYRHLPRLIYHLQTKWRDDPRPRNGLIRVREFTMKDSYSLDADWEGLDTQYRAHYQAYFNIFRRCGLDVTAVGADVGMMGGTLAHEFMYLTPIGEDTLLICDESGYRANRQIATFRKPPAEPEAPLPLEKIATPTTTTIESLAALLGTTTARTAKAVFMVATITEGDHDVTRVVFAIVRGDMDVNETKLANAVKAKDLRPAREDEIRAIGAEPGYGSPIGVRNALIVVDDAVPDSPNLVAGANEVGYHYRNVTYGRDYQADIVTDIALAREGDLDPVAGLPMRTSRAVEVGNIFKLGTRYSASLGATFLDRDGQTRPVIMGCYGIGVGRLLACVAEQYHDARGLAWPITVAPYAVHLVLLAGSAGGEATAVAERLYQALGEAGIDVLFDDREESPGVKFNDADLIGVPLRLTVGERALKRGGVELKRRDSADSAIVAVDEVIARVGAEIAALQAVIDARVVDEPYFE
ncbi:MAG: proline--tRNA ligase [Chloroflexi bacterium]|nr:proline--tRNA ligase [Chloroflexota bacterium]